MLTCLLGVNPIVFSFFLNNEVLTSASASSYDKRWMGEEVAIKFLKIFTILCKKKLTWWCQLSQGVPTFLLLINNFVATLRRIFKFKFKLLSICMSIKP